MENKLTSPFLLLKQAWTLALSRSNIVSYLILGAVPQLVSFAISATAGYSLGINNVFDVFTNTDKWGIVGFMLVAALVFFFGVLLNAWHIAFISKVYQASALGDFVNLLQYIRPANQATLHVLATYIVFWFMASMGSLLLIIPGIIIVVRYSFATIIAAVEKPIVKPLEESKRLVNGRFWKLVGRWLVLIVSHRVPLFILQSIHPALGTIWAITSPIFGLYFYLVYMDFKRTAAMAS